MVMASRDDLRLIVISLNHEMTKLEEFFEGVPIVDLHFLESTSSAASAAVTSLQVVDCDVTTAAATEDDLERRRREQVSRKRE